MNEQRDYRLMELRIAEQVEGEEKNYRVLGGIVYGYYASNRFGELQLHR